ncbi:MAG: hypothetical protein EHM78_16985 [Myxococcaceae bacterium]|nr:MAG: hypothetical protein EHM78_16985 [Myxococcaceae bacterium]
MRLARAAGVLFAPALLAAAPVSAQPVEHAGPEERPWSFGAGFSWYFVPDQNFGVVTATADHGPIHLEARYNYEAKRTASTFVGWNFEFGERVTVGLTPIVGCMFGEAGGPIVGLELALGWGPLSFSSQAEWVFDVQNDTGGFVYVWSELDVRPWEWLRAGMVIQRTRVFHTAREVVFGPLLGVTVWKLDLTAYWFQPGGIDQFFVASVGVSF